MLDNQYYHRYPYCFFFSLVRGDSPGRAERTLTPIACLPARVPINLYYTHTVLPCSLGEWLISALISMTQHPWASLPGRLHRIEKSLQLLNCDATPESLRPLLAP